MFVKNATLGFTLKVGGDGDFREGTGWGTKLQFKREGYEKGQTMKGAPLERAILFKLSFLFS